MKSLIIAGGGAAGWLAALTFKHRLPSLNVTLIESKQIGILGAGEGTTPHFIYLLEELGITIKEVIKNASGTIKNGIKFTNWNGDNKHYFHSFVDPGKMLSNTYIVGKRISEQECLDGLVPSAFLSYLNKAKVNYLEQDPAKDLIFSGAAALHFDASKLAAFLKEKALSRGINCIEGDIEEVIGDLKEEKIEGLKLKTGQIYSGDFYLDCTGFNRLIIGKFFKSPWVSYKDSIPNDSALAFLLPTDKDFIPPYTESIAMKYGWVWKIPTHNRYGCGYVYDSKVTTEEEIKKEILEKFPEASFVRTFKFEPGTFRKFWIGNCMALGLSSGFIEPLEATSIWSTVVFINTFFKNIVGVLEDNQLARDEVNNICYQFNEEVLSFIYLHYITKRKDTGYWSEFRTNNHPPDSFLKLEKTKDYIPYEELSTLLKNTFHTQSIICVGAGLRFFSETAGKSMMNREKFMGTVKTFINRERFDAEKVGALCRDCIPHIRIINSLKNEN